VIPAAVKLQYLPKPQAKYIFYILLMFLIENYKNMVDLKDFEICA
jgi:hypothetical protein